MLIAPLWVHAETIELKPVSTADGTFEPIKGEGVKGTKLADGKYSPYIYFVAPRPLPAFNGPIYIELTFCDLGRGPLSLQYNAKTAKDDYHTADVAFGRTLADSGAVRTAVFELKDADFRRAQNGETDLRIGHDDQAVPLHILKATYSTTPTPLFVERSTKGWVAPYKGPTRNDIDAKTLTGKVLCGYQGWFRCPGDDSERGWVHWSRNGQRIAPNTLTFEMWPDLTEFTETEKFLTHNFTLPDGTPAQLFSSANQKTVDRHFDWMVKYGIDGVLVQRFVGETRDPVEAARVLGYARRAANRTGRTFAVEYDMSGVRGPQLLTRIKQDWNWLVNEMKITEDSRYLHHNGKPVLAIFGFYPDRFDAKIAHEIIDFFQEPGKTQAVLIGGCPWQWRSEKNPEWARAFRRLDVMKPWNVGNTMNTGGKRGASTRTWEGDLADTRKNGRELMPVIYPGFSWDNLQRLPAGRSNIPRRGGEFLWEQFVAAKKMGMNMAFVAMFDEVDEGTAIFKVSNNPPKEARFVTLDGLPSDWYLRLVGEGTRLLRGERPLVEAIPIKP